MPNIYEKIILPVFGVFGTSLTLLTFIFPNYSNIKIPLYAYVATIFLFIIFLSVVIMILINTKREMKGTYRFNYFALTPIQFVPLENVFIIRKEIELPLNLSLSIYIKYDLYERNIGIANVSHIQNNFIQVKIIAIIDGTNISDYLVDTSNIRNIVIRPSSNINDIIASIKGGI